MCGMRALQEMKHCLVYSLGSQGDTSFEDEFLDRTVCEVCFASFRLMVILFASISASNTCYRIEGGVNLHVQKLICSIQA